jgi:small subunit ribosomal protein S14
MIFWWQESVLELNGHSSSRSAQRGKIRCTCRCYCLFGPQTHNKYVSLKPCRMPPRPNIRVLRDIKARKGVAENEISRRAYLYVARNQTLPAQVRYQAQLQLNTFGRYTRPTTVKNRCTVTGRGRGIIGEFGLCRVRSGSHSLPGVGSSTHRGTHSSSFGRRRSLVSCQASKRHLGRGI